MPGLDALDEASGTHFILTYAAIVTTPTTGTDNGAEASDSAKPTPPPEIASRADFRVGGRVSFTDMHLQHRGGLIVRTNQHTPRWIAVVKPGALGSECLGLSSTSE